MDGTRFDELTRSLGQRRDRRGVLKTLGAAALGAAGVAGVRFEADAATKVGVCHRAGSASHPYQYITVDLSAVPAHRAHGDAINPNFQTDSANCGACGVVCDPASQTCVAGQCVAHCAGVDCSAQTGACTTGVCDPATGACSAQPANVGQSCNDGLACTSGDVCQANGTCGGGTATDCSGFDSDCTVGQCSEPDGCAAVPANEGGACATATGVTGTCTSGTCAPNSCATAQLFGDPDGNFLCVDDELAVYVNGYLAFEYRGPATCLPVPIGPVTNGDTIEVVANNSPEFCGWIYLSPFYLVCQDTGAVETLDPVGVDLSFQGDPPCAGDIFYDRTFTVEI